MKSIRQLLKLREYSTRKKVALGAVLASGSLLLSFQNCSRVSIANLTPSAASINSVPSVNLSQNVVITQVNVPATLGITVTVSAATVSFDQDSVVHDQDIANGHVNLNTVTNFLTYTPTYGFRGQTSATVYTRYANTTDVLTVTFVVENPTLKFSPALAVRGPECISCHGVVNGDMLSDYGFKGAGDVSPDYFFATGANAVVTPYNVTNSAGDSLSTATIQGNLVIPRVSFASLDPSVARYFQFGQTTKSLKSYIDTSQAPVGSNYLGSTEVSSLYIGAPTAADITTAGALTSATKMNYYPNTSNAPALSGFVHVTANPTTGGAVDYYGNSGAMVCEGDLFIDGVVFLDHLKVKTVAGCRIYSTRSVFIAGPITYVNEVALSNVEITSAIGVYLGTGYCTDCDDAVSYGYQGHDSLLQRWQGTIYDYSPGFRATSVANHISDIQTDIAKVSIIPGSLPSDVSKAHLQALGVQLFDSSNSAIGETATPFDRLLLNAPDVQARYTGNFDGIVIAEFAMWRLADFNFTFEPIFTGVPLFPFLNFEKILKVTP